MGLFDRKQKKAEIEKTAKKNKAREKFLDIKATPIKEKPTTRQVRLYYESCCGCGCHAVEILRTVPASSDLQNGDSVLSMEKGDKEL